MLIIGWRVYSESQISCFMWRPQQEDEYFTAMKTSNFISVRRLLVENDRSGLIDTVWKELNEVCVTPSYPTGAVKIYLYAFLRECSHLQTFQQTLTVMYNAVVAINTAVIAPSFLPSSCLIPKSQTTHTPYGVILFNSLRLHSELQVSSPPKLCNSMWLCAASLAKWFLFFLSPNHVLFTAMCGELAGFPVTLSSADGVGFPSKRQTLSLFTLGQISPISWFLITQRLPCHSASLAFMHLSEIRHQLRAHFLGTDHLQDAASHSDIPCPDCAVMPTQRARLAD